MSSLWSPPSACLAYSEEKSWQKTEQNQPLWKIETSSVAAIGAEARLTEKHNMASGVKLRWKWKTNGSLCPKNPLSQGVKMRYCFYYTLLMLRHWFFFYLLVCFSISRISSSALPCTSQLHMGLDWESWLGFWQAACPWCGKNNIKNSVDLHSIMFYSFLTCFQPWFGK